MTEQELDAIEARAKELWDRGAPVMAARTLLEDVPAMVAEVRRRRDVLREVRVGPGYPRPIRDAQERALHIDSCPCNLCNSLGCVRCDGAAEPDSNYCAGCWTKLLSDRARAKNQSHDSPHGRP